MARLHPSYRIVPYDPAWAAIFETERACIADALGPLPNHIEHIGSTAVPGLGAKPIVDVMVGVGSEADFPRHVALLSPFGYEHRGEAVPGTLYNRKQGPPRVNAHLTVLDGPFWVDKILFRDYLRVHVDTAREYEALKRRILLDVGQDPPKYNAAKAAFIEAVLEKARTAVGPPSPSV